ncbi:hypothetical protein GCM10022256_04340 [Frondihabitans peucedani]|uniref:Uncharacterized protein n=1 Tax=Frondihabitans peucedani TaxID=598626 RepID=A0ABP8DY24_9MICO
MKVPAVIDCTKMNRTAIPVTIAKVFRAEAEEVGRAGTGRRVVGVVMSLTLGGAVPRAPCERTPAHSNPHM